MHVCFRLEGELESLRLPQTLRESIRLRLAGVAESDANLGFLLKLAAVLGGSFSFPAMARVWGVYVESEVTLLHSAIQRGLELKFLKFVSPSRSGPHAGGPGRRRSSSSSNDESRWCFHHRAIAPASTLAYARWSVARWLSGHGLVLARLCIQQRGSCQTQA